MDVWRASPGSDDPLLDSVGPWEGSRRKRLKRPASNTVRVQLGRSSFGSAVKAMWSAYLCSPILNAKRPPCSSNRRNVRPTDFQQISGQITRHCSDGWKRVVDKGRAYPAWWFCISVNLGNAPRELALTLRPSSLQAEACRSHL